MLAPAGAKTPDIMNRRLKGLEQRIGVEPRRLSPYHNVTKDLPSTIIFHGMADTTVPFLTVREFSELAKKMGNRCELVGYPGEPHGFFNWGRDGNKNFINTVKLTDVFLRSLGYIEGPDTVEEFTAAGF